MHAAAALLLAAALFAPLRATHSSPHGTDAHFQHLRQRAVTLPTFGIKDAVSDAAAVNALLTTNFTYVIVGGGTAGLVLAARLSENADVSVAVLEAGGREDSNPAVTIPANSGAAFGTQADWAFSTSAQSNVNNRQIYTPRGKALGGGTVINFAVYTRGDAPEYDAWEGLGNAGWNYASLQAASKKSEKFTKPSTSVHGSLATNFTSVASAHGTSGPFDTSFPPFMPRQWVGFTDGLKSLGVPANADVDDGSNYGVSFSPTHVNPSGFVRETTHTAYLNPIASTRKNLIVFTSAQATKINWGTAVGGKARATGVTFVAGGVTSTIQASKEIILSAGSVLSPQLLELSGIGNPSIMNPLGISTVVNLPGVGENLQDHLLHMEVFRLKPGIQSNDDLSFNATYKAEAESLYAQGKGPLTHVVTALAFLKAADFMTSAEITQLKTLVATSGQAISAEQLAAQTKYLTSSPIIEPVLANSFFGTGSGSAKASQSYISIGSALQHAFSRGNIHITSANPLTPPKIDPRYLSHPADIFIVSKSLQYIRKLSQTAAFAPFIASEQEPGSGVTTEAQWQAFAKSNLGTEFHLLGTCAMLPQAKAGVVDNNLKVYGTNNVRVVDLSIAPLHVSSHPVSLVLGIAEIAATKILAA